MIVSIAAARQRILHLEGRISNQSAILEELLHEGQNGMVVSHARATLDALVDSLQLARAQLKRERERNGSGNVAPKCPPLDPA
jgi:uncharacterized coiled-coil protein SlyX